MSARRRAIFSVVFMLLTCGCSATIIPPPAPVNPVPVYVADFGRHSSLILPNPARGWTEYSWAEWDWFARGNAHWYMAPRALFFSDHSTLCQRNFGPQKNEQALRHKLGASRITQIDCSADRVAALRDCLNERFSRQSLSLYHGGYSEMDHVIDDEHYWLGRNCNQMTARWLRQLGCDVRGWPFLSHFKLQSRQQANRGDSSVAIGLALPLVHGR